MKTKTTGALAGLVALAAIGAGAAVASGTAEHERPITGAALERATAVALQATGRGRVTATEAGDEQAYYEVELRLADGSQVDVRLDQAFRLVAVDRDEEQG